MTTLAALLICCSCGQQPSPAAETGSNMLPAPQDNTSGSGQARPGTGSLPHTPVSPSTSLPPSDEPVNMAMDIMSSRTGLAISGIKLLSVERKDWPDASLGLPQPGLMYAQAVVPGYIIKLTAGSSTYTFHAGWSQRWTVLLVEIRGNNPVMNQ